MQVKSQCSNPECQRTYNLSAEYVGKSVRCKQCGQSFTVTVITTESVRETRVKTSDTSEVVLANTGKTRVAGSPQRLGRFEVHEKLGGGAFGVVYRAFDPQLEREVALKVPRPGTLDDAEAVVRFLREAKAAAQLRHPNIVPIYDAGRDGEQYYIASAFISGHPLDKAVEAGAVEPRRAARIVRELAEAFDYAHGQGILHRDIKPANVMLDDKDHPHVMDFGLARLDTAASKLTQDGSVMGTPAYMSPEQAAGENERVNAASDQYSLGVLFYELLTGQTPFSGPPQIVIVNVLTQPPKPPRALKPDVPRDLETICLKAMAKEQERRYGSCREFAEDLERWLSDEPILARPMQIHERFARWCRREPQLATLMIAIFFAGLIAFGTVGVVLLDAQSKGQLSLPMALSEPESLKKSEQHRRDQVGKLSAELNTANNELAKLRLQVLELQQQEASKNNSAPVSSVEPATVEPPTVEPPSTSTNAITPTEASSAAPPLIVSKPDATGEIIFSAADRPKLQSMYPASKQRLLKTHRFDKNIPFKKLGESYESQGVFGIRANTGVFGWNFEGMVAKQMIRTKVRVRNNLSGQAGICLTQNGGLHGVMVSITGDQRVLLAPSFFAKEKPEMLQRAFKLPDIVRPLEVWNDLTCVLRNDSLSVFVNNVHVETVDLTTHSIVPATLSFAILAKDTDTVVEMDEYSLYSVK